MQIKHIATSVDYQTVSNIGFITVQGLNDDYQTKMVSDTE